MLKPVSETNEALDQGTAVASDRPMLKPVSETLLRFPMGTACLLSDRPMLKPVSETSFGVIACVRQLYQTARC